MTHRLAALAGFGAALVAGAAMGQSAIPTRTPLATLPIAAPKTVARVEATQVDFAPGQAMPRHMHTVPVVCFVTKGEFLAHIGDAPERRVSEGGVTYEAPGETVWSVRNASTSTPAQLRCAVLAGADDTVLNRMLDDAPKP